MAELSTSRVTRRPRLRRLIPAPLPCLNENQPAPQPHPLFLFVASVWLGLITGPAEVGLVLLQKHLRDGTPGFFQMNRQIVWMIPLFHLLLFIAAGATIGLTARFRSKFSSPRAAFFLGFLALSSLALAVRSIHWAASLVLVMGLSYRLAPWLERFCLTSRRLVVRSFPLTVAGFLSLFGVSIGAETWAESRSLANLTRASSDAPNVVLIVMDTVSASHMSLHGYSRATTPNLARLASRGVRFENARSTAPWTLPSHASLFTGRWPHELAVGYHQPLGSGNPTLAEALRDQGYATGGFVANTLYCSAETGLSRGFIHYEDHDLSPLAVLHSAAFGRVVLAKLVAFVAQQAGVGVRLFSSDATASTTTGAGVTPPARPYKDSSRLCRDALRWLDQHEGRPRFLFLNLFDAHTPYLKPADGAAHFGRVPQTRADYAVLNAFWEADKNRLSARDIELARDAYDDCLAHLDHQVGRLFDELDRRGVLGNSIVIITSDHGEQFGEHGLFGHASSLYRGEVHVPLLVIAPGRVPEGRVVQAPVSLRNVPATVLDLIGDLRSPRFPGTSLARHWRATLPVSLREVEVDPVLSEVFAPAKNSPNHGRSPVFRGSMSSLIVDDKVYIRHEDGAEELYDLESDPTESRNLALSPTAGPALAAARRAWDQACDRQPH